MMKLGCRPLSFRILSQSTLSIVKPSLHCTVLGSTRTRRQHTLHLPEIDPAVASIHSISENPCFHLLGICKSVSSLKKIHALLIVHGQTGELLFKTKILGLYGVFGHIKSARKVFDQIRSPDLYSCKVMMRWYFLNDMYREVIRFYTCMWKCIEEPDNSVFSIVLKASSELRCIDVGRNAHNLIVKTGSPDSFVMSGLVDMYAKCGDMKSARVVFDNIVEGNVVCWTSIIVAYVQNDCAKEALILFNRMRNGLVEGNEYTFGSIITACTKLGSIHQGKGVHGYVIKYGINVNSHMVTALVDMYIKCGTIEDARSVFDEYGFVDLVPWTAMVVGYTQRGYPDEALKLFTNKRWGHVFPNSVTATSVLSACAQSGKSKLGMSVHSLVIKLDLEDNSVITALMDMYAKCHMIREAHCLFETVSDKDVVAWNSIINGYSLNGSVYMALRLFQEMRLESSCPDEVTLVAVLSACTSIGNLQAGSSLHACSIKEGLLSSGVHVLTALINLYAKCGDTKSARIIFDGMEEKNEITWGAMINGYGMQGDGHGCTTLFNDMLEEKLVPSDATFAAILSSCSHTGMIEEGLHYFNQMCHEFKYVPSMKHYVCVVDLLARAGRLEEALDLIEKMPIQPDGSLFGAFLHGCRLYSRFDLGKVAARRILELHPDDASYYVLISNLYASDGRWSQVHRLRNLMKMRGLSKSAASCQVATDINSDCSFLRVASVG